MHDGNASSEANVALGLSVDLPSRRNVADYRFSTYKGKYAAFKHYGTATPLSLRRLSADWCVKSTGILYIIRFKITGSSSVRNPGVKTA